MRYIKQLSTYTDLQTHIRLVPLSGLWHFTMFCRKIIFYTKTPTMKDIFYFWDIATFFPSVFFSLKEPWFFDSHPFHWRNYETMDTWSPTRSQNTCERLSTEVLRKRWSSSAFAYLCYNYRPSYWVEIGWKVPYFAFNVGWLHCIFIFLWEAFQVQHLRNKGRYQLR